MPPPREPVVPRDEHPRVVLGGLRKLDMFFTHVASQLVNEIGGIHGDYQHAWEEHREFVQGLHSQLHSFLAHATGDRTPAVAQCICDCQQVARQLMQQVLVPLRGQPPVGRRELAIGIRSLAGKTKKLAIEFHANVRQLADRSQGEPRLPELDQAVSERFDEGLLVATAALLATAVILAAAALARYPG